MRAWQLQGVGPSTLKLVDAPAPEPGPLDVLVRVEHVSLNFRDMVVVDGGYGRLFPTPLIPGSDAAGTVIAVGSQVRRFAIGDRVMSCFFQRWLGGAPSLEALASSLGGPHDGVFRELVSLNEEAWLRVPDVMSTRAACTLPCAAVTAWNALAVLDHVGAASTVLVQGTGGVSLFALQLAKALGATVIATSSRDDKLERACALGADHGIHYVREPQWGKAAKALTGGRGVDHVVEVGGAGTLAQSLRAVAPGACISLIGVLSGAKHEVHLPYVFLPQVRLQGVVVGARDAAEQLLRAIVQHHIEPVIDDARFELAELPQALEHMRAGNHFGKVVVDVEPA